MIPTKGNTSGEPKFNESDDFVEVNADDNPKYRTA